MTYKLLLTKVQQTIVELDEADYEQYLEAESTGDSDEFLDIYWSDIHMDTVDQWVERVL